MKELTSGPVFRRIFAFALPMLVGNVLQQLYVFVDSIIVGKFIGKQALAAIGASFPIIFALISLVIGLVSGTTVIISQYFGAKEHVKVRKAIETMFVYLLIISVVIPVLGILFSKNIFNLVGLPEDVIPEAVQYFNIFIGGSLVLFYFNGTNAVLRGLGDSKTPVYFMVISTVLNIVFDMVFVLVFNWGIGSIALSTVIAHAIGFIVSFWYLKKSHSMFDFSLLKLRFDKQIFKKSFKIGFPTGLQQVSVSLSLMAMVAVVSMFGTNVLAAYTVGARISSLASMPAMVFGTALSIFVGQNIGANKTNRVKTGLKAVFAMSSVVAIIITCIVVFFGQGLMKLFTNDPHVIEIGMVYLRIIGSFYLIFNAMFIVSGLLRGAGDTLIPMIINVIALWIVRVPIAYFGSKEFGESGIWWAFPISWFIATALYYFRYLTGIWKNKSVINKKATIPN
jgi:putative MATE family efflux protein